VREHLASVADLRRRGYRVVDTMERMVGELRAGRSPFFLEGHWNAHGHEVAADELIRALAELAR
jgi:hypothetical protein